MDDTDKAPVNLYLTNSEAAAILRLAPSTLTKMRMTGDGPAFHKFGQKVLYTRTDLDAWASQHKFKMTSDPAYPQGSRRRNPIEQDSADE